MFELASDYLPYIFMGALAGVVYCGWNYFTKTQPGLFETKRLVASVIFGVGIGVIGGYTLAQTGTTIESSEWWVVMGGLFIAYQGALQWVNRGVDVLWIYLYGTKIGGSHWFFEQWITSNVIEPLDELKTNTLYYRKMNEDRLSNMVFDQPPHLQQPIRECVSAAEFKTTWRYVIQAGAWEYLIEYGVQTGGKHYWYYKSPKVDWKPISVETLENIRKTGKWPDYSQLMQEG